MINLKKKEFAIYAIALMLVTAGYFNYLNFDFKSLKTSARVEENDVNMISDNQEIADVSIDTNSNKEDESELNTNEEDNIVETESNHDKQVEVSSNDVEDTKEENKTNIGDAVLVNSNETVEKSSSADTTKDYYAATKLERNQMYAEMIKNYEYMINNPNLSEIQKSIAREEITTINNNKNAIMICENLILSKDFDECVILINDQSVNIVVHVKDGLNTEKVSQIQNIISRELATEIENIHISEK